MENELVKIVLPVEHSDKVESAFARQLANGNLTLDNIPLYAYNISWGDEFSATLVNGRLTFSTIKRRSGHSTYRVKLKTGATHDEFLARWPRFESHGCGYEGSGVDLRRLYSIDIPPQANIDELYALLVQGESEGFWDFEEAHYGRDG